MKTLFNKITKKIILPLVVAGAFVFNSYSQKSDGNYTREHLDTTYEKGRVINTFHNKEHNSMDITPGLSLMGIFLNHTSRITTPEKWGVVFRCEHQDEFIISGSKERYEELYNRLNEGDYVIISYKEIYKVEYNGKTGKAIRKKMIDSKFINAKKILK